MKLHAFPGIFEIFSLPTDVINLWVEKFEFDNPTIMEDKLCKQMGSMEQFSVLAKESDDFLLLDEKSKQSYKVKIKNIQGYDPFIR